MIDALRGTGRLGHKLGFLFRNHRSRDIVIDKYQRMTFLPNDLQYNCRLRFWSKLKDQEPYIVPVIQ